MQDLHAKTRKETGRKANALRKAGFLPAVVYGEGVASRSITVAHADFTRVLRSAGESTLVQLQVEEKPYTVIIHDIAYDPLTSRPTHADFYAVRMDKALRVTVPIAFTGESDAVKNDGGVLVKVAHELEIEALPGDLPHMLLANLSKLSSFGDRILVKDIQPLKGVKILAPPDEVIAIVEAPRSEEELAALNEAPAAAAVEVKTEAEIKKETKAEVETVAEGAEKKQ